ncbi:uncharacterized protein LOC121490507 [Vulpes lagopus]|uniref:uncharacterized protein LOC121490507 n=1 Tax=Vulpes lagopus TaxID=494514 RepID=UPI001BCA38DE|nr:uncharacterized protein LOC121490507 [Vulpes lagopus]
MRGSHLVDDGPCLPDSASVTRSLAFIPCSDRSLHLDSPNPFGVLLIIHALLTCHLLRKSSECPPHPAPLPRDLHLHLYLWGAESLPLPQRSLEAWAAPGLVRQRLFPLGWAIPWVLISWSFQARHSIKGRRCAWSTPVTQKSLEKCLALGRRSISARGIELEVSKISSEEAREGNPAASGPGRKVPRPRQVHLRTEASALRRFTCPPHHLGAELSFPASPHQPLGRQRLKSTQPCALPGASGACQGTPEAFPLAARPVGQPLSCCPSVHGFGLKAVKDSSSQDGSQALLPRKLCSHPCGSPRLSTLWARGRLRLAPVVGPEPGASSGQKRHRPLLRRTCQWSSSSLTGGPRG